MKKKYDHFGIFMRTLAEERETWDFFCVARGEFPADDEFPAMIRSIFSNYFEEKGGQQNKKRCFKLEENLMVFEITSFSMASSNLFHHEKSLNLENGS